MNSPPLGAKSKTAVPAYLTSGSSPLHVASELRTEIRDKKERETLYASIQSSSTHRQPINLEAPIPNGYAQKTRAGGQHGIGPIHSADGLIEEPARDHRDEAALTTPTASRPASPFTQHPTIDFDGLSWPSEWRYIGGASTVADSAFYRRRYSGTPRGNS